MKTTSTFRSLLLPALLVFSLASPSFSYAGRDYHPSGPRSRKNDDVVSMTALPLNQRPVEWMNRSSINNVDHKLQKKVNELISDIFANGNLGKPESLHGFYRGTMSRRIDAEHRLIYKIDRKNNKLSIFECGGHYKYS